jgi:hypothetical protein
VRGPVYVGPQSSVAVALYRLPPYLVRARPSPESTHLVPPTRRAETLSDNVTDARDPTVQIQCPSCAATPAAMVYRHFVTVTLMCVSCLHIWVADVESHPALKATKPIPRDSHGH